MGRTFSRDVLLEEKEIEKPYPWRLSNDGLTNQIIFRSLDNDRSFSVDVAFVMFPKFQNEKHKCWKRPPLPVSSSLWIGETAFEGLQLFSIWFGFGSLLHPQRYGNCISFVDSTRTFLFCHEWLWKRFTCPVYIAYLAGWSFSVSLYDGRLPSTPSTAFCPPPKTRVAL